MKRCFTFSLSVFFAALVLWTIPAKASTLFTNFGPSSSYDTGNANLVGNDFGGDNLAQGDAFQVSSTGMFGDIQIALSCFSTCTDPFTITLNHDSGDAPGSVIESFTGAGSLLGTFGNSNAPLLFTSLLNPTLTSGTLYWITVSTDLNDTIAFGDNIVGDLSDTAISYDGGATYYSPSYGTPGAFQIDSAAVVSTGAAPEPESLVLLMSGLPLLAYGRRSLLRRTRS